MNNRYTYLVLILVTIMLASGCKSIQSGTSKKSTTESWFNIAVAEDVEIFIDTASIRSEGAISYAREKRIYITSESKKLYVDKIRAEYTKMKKPEKANRWNDFSYCIYNCLYECTNKRFRVLSVEDYDSTGKLIAKTTPAKGVLKWLNVDSETVGDYTFFFVCDYGQ